MAGAKKAKWRPEVETTKSFTSPSLMGGGWGIRRLGFSTEAPFYIGKHLLRIWDIIFFSIFLVCSIFFLGSFVFFQCPPGAVYIPSCGHTNRRQYMFVLLLQGKFSTKELNPMENRKRKFKVTKLVWSWGCTYISPILQFPSLSFTQKQKTDAWPEIYFAKQSILFLHMQAHKHKHILGSFRTYL